MDSAFGRYRLLERLGQGGMAEVFKAKSYGVEGFEKILVIKRILPELSSRQDFVDMFIHEAKLAVRLSHANIVQVFDLGKAASGDRAASTDHHAYYIAMEYVHGLDLASVLARCRRKQTLLPIPMSVYIASEVAKGLDHAHRRRDEQMRPLGIVHRDVSPQNVLLSLEGEVKITDFGIAKARSALERDAADDTHARRLQGKFAYMSPEQSRGDAVDARSDLFSLGTLVYECVAGVNPFSAPTTFETLRRVQACEYPPLELLRPDVPRDLHAVVQRAMAKEPDERYADAGRMYEGLLAFLYAQGGRSGAHELAAFLAPLRDADSSRVAGPDRLFETDGVDARAECTPVELPSTPPSSNVRIASGVLRPSLDRPADLGERRDVTALVLELPRHTTEDVMLRAAALIERWGGWVLRREGGHVEALFGLADPDGRDSEMATRCALVALRTIAPDRLPGIGLHVGRVHLSGTGLPAEDDRLMALLDGARELARSREGRATMSAHGMRQVEALFEFEPLARSDRAARDVSGVLVKAVRGPAEGFGRFVGRKEELRQIGGVLTLAANRAARVLTIRGDHGVGKTRLLYEAERRLRKGGYDVGFHIAACPPCGGDFPFSGIVGMLQVLCATSEGDAPDRILAVEPRLRALGLNNDEVRAVLAALGAGVPSAGGDSGALLRQAFAKMVQSLCADRPHTFAWDVAHAMDPESYALLGDIVRRSRHARLVFLFAARAGFSHPLEQLDSHVAIDLADLSAAEGERLISLRLGVERVPEDLLRFVRSRAGGHPLFIEEVIKALLDAGAVSVAEHRVVSMKLVAQDLALPKTLRGLVASRVARLSPEDRATLQAAAVLRDPIDVAVLSSTLGVAMPSLERSIATLGERDFLVHVGPAELRFVSPMVAEILADALTPGNARDLHAAAGRALQETLGARSSEHAARIAAHLYEAGDREAAAGYFAKSGERRLATRQLEAAARDFARAIALTDSPTRVASELVVWLEHMASAVRLVRSSPDARDLCDRVIERVDRDGQREGRVRARVAAGRLLAAVHRIEESRARLAEAAAISGEEPVLFKLVSLAEAELATRQGDFKRALVRLNELRTVLVGSSDDHERHRVALHLAESHAALGDRATAFANLREAERWLPGDPAAAFERKKVQALVDYFTRDFRSAAARSEEAIQLGRDLGLSHEVMLHLHNLGGILVQLDDLPRAYGAVRQSLSLCEEHGDERFANSNRMLLAFLDGVQGGEGDGAPSATAAPSSSEGEKQLRHGIAYAESRDFTWDVIGGRLLLARLLRRLGRVAPAHREFEVARDLAVRAGHRLVADDCELALGELAPGGVRAGD